MVRSEARRQPEPHSARDSGVPRVGRHHMAVFHLTRASDDSIHHGCMVVDRFCHLDGWSCRARRVHSTHFLRDGRCTGTAVTRSTSHGPTTADRGIAAHAIGCTIDESIPMFDFDPRDRDEDVRDVEMPWIELRRCAWT